MTLLALVRLLVGVKVAVQVLPPSLLDTALKVPLATVRSALVKPVTTSLKVIVTVAVSPTLRAVSLSVMVAVGGTVSWMATDTDAALEVPPSPSLTVTDKVRVAWPMLLAALLLS